MPAVSSSQVTAWRPLVASIAREYVRSRAARRVGAEYDDLEQEGLIFVWQSLERGIPPAAELVEGRMKNWVRYISRQREMAGVPYGLMLPLDSYARVA
jgi:hypothetical protein